MHRVRESLRLRASVAVFLPAVLATLLVAAQAGAQCDVYAQAGAANQTLTAGVASANDATTFGFSNTTASFGTLTAFSNVSLPDSGSDDGSSPIPVARYQDELTVTIPSQPGLFSGTMRVAFYVVGEPTIDLSAAGPGAIHNMNTSYNMIGTRNGGALYSVAGGRIQATGALPELTTLGTVPAPGRVEVDFPVVFGFPLTLGFELSSVTGGNQVIPPGLSGSVSGTSDVAFYWDGIVSIDDGSGNDILADANIASCSGIDWQESQLPPPVPLGALLGVGVALGCLGVGARSLAKTR